MTDRPDRYNPANVSELEDYLYDQVKRGTYDFLANMATLKLSVSLFLSVRARHPRQHDS
jgi:hypothetical protein